MICSSRRRAVPLALSALEYLAARVNTELEARGATVAVENDIAVTPSGVPTAPSAELLAAAERSAPAVTELGMLRPIARPLGTVPTVPLASTPPLTAARSAAGEYTLTIPVHYTGPLMFLTCYMAFVVLTSTYAQVTTVLDLCGTGSPSAASFCTSGALLRDSTYGNFGWLVFTVLVACMAMLSALVLWPGRWVFTLTADGSWTLRTCVLGRLPVYRTLAAGKDLLGVKVCALCWKPNGPGRVVGSAPVSSCSVTEQERNAVVAPRVGRVLTSAESFG
jgi:hypothetical protein